MQTGLNALLMVNQVVLIQNDCNESTCLVSKGEVEILKSLDLDGYMVVIDTGVKGSTKQAVEDVHRLCDNDESYMNVIEHIGSLVYLASDAINHHSFDRLANIFNQCQDDLRTLTVSHDKIETLLEMETTWCSSWEINWRWTRR